MIKDSFTQNLVIRHCNVVINIIIIIIRTWDISSWINIAAISDINIDIVDIWLRIF